MSVWFMISGAFLLIVFLEESIYYGLNRYVNGKNNQMRSKWKNRLFVVLGFFKRKKSIDIETNHQEKSSS
ncbi:hypothetical protein FB550_101354 [Neobacillus bataviensis]|uniref:Uncharacterized protein n=1 Tax=Neobacillus bataviensis TaxID=220685 RepID=A0A561DYB7_9BACI|nr:hypothetical protein [Neobacillus bataviensis]TWE08336.1 hypothetical protein FB550_101354 [Neobacillus bataviensis]